MIAKLCGGGDRCPGGRAGGVDVHPVIGGGAVRAQIEQALRLLIVERQRL